MVRQEQFIGKIQLIMVPQLEQHQLHNPLVVVVHIISELNLLKDVGEHKEVLQ